MEKKASQDFHQDKEEKYNIFSDTNRKYLSNDDYIRLLYNSKNNGTNINFPLNVIYNKKKSKNTK